MLTNARFRNSNLNRCDIFHLAQVGIKTRIPIKPSVVMLAPLTFLASFLPRLAQRTPVRPPPGHRDRI